MAVDIHSVATSQVVTADGVVGSSGRDTIIWSAVLAGGSDAATVDIHAGTGTGGTKHITLKSVATDSSHLSSGGKGIYLSGGAYCNVTGTSPSVTVVYSQSNE
jgi:hypothetical protein